MLLTFARYWHAQGRELDASFAGRRTLLLAATLLWGGFLRLRLVIVIHCRSDAAALSGCCRSDAL
jgi:hypothetical protein